MKTIKQNAERFREILWKGDWVAGTNFKTQLADLTWEQATQTAGPFHTIASLTFHIHYYISGILKVLEGGALEIKDKYSFDMPPIRCQKDWQKLMNRLWEDAEKFADAVEKMSEKRLKEVFVEERYGNYQRNIDGMIEHCYYHLGQIVLIRKMIFAKT